MPHYFTPQLQETAKSCRGGRHDQADNRSADAGSRGGPSSRHQRHKAPSIRLAGARSLLPQNIRLQVQEDTGP